jgi:predicted N-formylglutamate amidohydrolase
MKPLRPSLIMTCEHADFKTPVFLKKGPQIPARILNSHRGWDAGALPLAKGLAHVLHGQVFFYPYSRLYLDANRKIGVKALSDYTRDLPDQDQQRLFTLCQLYRNSIWQEVEKSLKRKAPVFIFSLHTFVPILQGKRRTTDIGLLFRRGKRGEEEVAQDLRQNLKALAPGCRTHFNRPYRGHTDCLFNDVMDDFAKERNLKGLFLEVNQAYLRRQGLAAVQGLLREAISPLLS